MPRSKLPKLSDAQIRVLKLGAIYRLSRSSMGWSAPDGRNPVRIYSQATIKSLAKLGLIDANFDDPRGFGPCSGMQGIQNLDGTRFKHSPTVPILSVWTNSAGMEVLKSLGLTDGKQAFSNLLADIDATEKRLRDSDDVINLLDRRRSMAKNRAPAPKQGRPQHKEYRSNVQ